MDGNQQSDVKDNSPPEQFLGDTSGKLGDEEVIQIRKDKIVKFFKTNWNWIIYFGLALVVFLSVRIRTRNLSELKDITTGTWTLGPDLDPFLFLRWSEYIVEHGKLFAVDMMRYVPLGYNTKGELILHPYMMAWFHKIATVFGSDSVTHSAVLYPVFFFAITVIAFFFFVREIFADTLGKKSAGIIALIASFFLTVIPVLLPRTIAGIPEKESAAFFFMFATFYFFLKAWKSKKNISRYIYALLAGVFTAGMALVWGGVIFVFLTIAPAVFVAFILGNTNKERLYAYAIWIISTFIIVRQFSTRYTLIEFVRSIDTGFAFLVLLIIAFHSLIYGTRLRNYLEYQKLKNIPPQIISSVISLIVAAVIVSIFFGPSFIPLKIQLLVANLVSPSQNRLLLTVAENRQPFFTEWAGSFGPYIKNIPLTFWLFFFGSVYLFYSALKTLRKKDRWVLAAFYLIFLISLIFSRYSSDSKLNGVNTTSILLYSLGFVLFICAVFYYRFQYYKKNEEEKLRQIDFGFILIFTLFFLSIVAARAAVRTILVLVPSVAVMVGYLCVRLFEDVKKMEKNTKKTMAWGLVILIFAATLFSGYSFYKSVDNDARGYIPSIYTQQWQKAMFWVRENTPENAVFGHWWDYGYWLQSIGKRATVLDGGNAISYWNHLMGRHALTGTNDRDAIEFLYAHNATHFLIDSSDIGKYTAFSSIGSNVDYDRRSWITTFLRDNNQVQETKNGTILFYVGGTSLDSDIVYEQNGTRIFLPAGNAGIGAVLIEKDPGGELVSQPIGIFFYQNQQYRLPLRYAYNKKFVDYRIGVESGIYIFPRLEANNLDYEGALIYLSERTVKSQLARLYLYKEDNSYFKLVHSEDDFLVAQIKTQQPSISDIVYYNGVRGPIRIWEIDYPGDIETKGEYLRTVYPPELLQP